MSGHLRSVPDDETAVDPVEEMREGVEVLTRLTTNPLLSDIARSALGSSKELLDIFINTQPVDLSPPGGRGGSRR